MIHDTYKLFEEVEDDSEYTPDVETDQIQGSKTSEHEEVTENESQENQLEL